MGNFCRGCCFVNGHVNVAYLCAYYMNFTNVFTVMMFIGVFIDLTFAVVLMYGTFVAVFKDNSQLNFQFCLHM